MKKITINKKREEKENIKKERERAVIVNRNADYGSFSVLFGTDKQLQLNCFIYSVD